MVVMEAAEKTMSKTTPHVAVGMIFIWEPFCNSGDSSSVRHRGVTWSRFTDEESIGKGRVCGSGLRTTLPGFPKKADFIWD